MGKTYIDTVKYIVYTCVEIDGIVEKPDVVGAIFGQTEGLLGDELDLRELQKSGRVGRIDVDLDVKNGKSIGVITLPSSLDQVETAILAAALESVDRVGPCEAKIKVERIEDTRTVKRDFMVGRAKEILRSLITDKLPESREISELVREEVKIAEAQSFGPEKLTAGPNIFGADNIIIAEGRADVLNLLKCDIKNVIALQGKNIPKSVVDLAREKTVTLFVDGDRGGDLVIKQFANAAEIDFIAKAPDGKEVEELTKKEIIKCLRSRAPYEQYIGRAGGQRPKEEVGMDQQFEEALKKLEGTLKAVLLDQEMKMIAETDVRDLVEKMDETPAYAVVLDGIITQRLVDAAQKKRISYLVGVRRSRIKDFGDVQVLTAE